MVAIPVEKVMQHWNPFESDVWGCGQVTRDMVTKNLTIGYGEPPPLCEYKLEHRRYHAARIAWFVENGWPDAISIDVGDPINGSDRDWLVDDGNHRLAAAIYRGDRLIQAEVSGDLDYAHELFGVSEKEAELIQAEVIGKLGNSLGIRCGSRCY
jgi:hypothetical protein